jgi:thiol-disulfide isomerase/thioredoxin
MASRAWRWSGWALGLVFLLVLGSLPRAASGQPVGVIPAPERLLGVGDAAPALAGLEWIRGEAVQSLSPGKVYAVEFWATWCGPCIAAFPHLTSVQEHFGEGVVVIGVTAEDPMQSAEEVRAFVAEREEEMGYRVALDRTGRVRDSWMAAAGMSGIPCVFVVDKSGRVVWIGHPGGEAFEEVVASVVEDRFDLDAALRRRAEERARRAALEEAQRSLHRAWEAGDVDRAFALADEIVAVDPPAMRDWAVWKFRSLLTDPARARRGEAYARSLMEGDYAEDAEMLRRLASGIAGSIGVESPDLDLALELAERAVSVHRSRDADTLAVLALVRQARGETAEAIAALERGAEVATHERQRRRLLNELELVRMEAEMAARRSGGG